MFSFNGITHFVNHVFSYVVPCADAYRRTNANTPGHVVRIEHRHAYTQFRAMSCKRRLAGENGVYQHTCTPTYTNRGTHS